MCWNPFSSSYNRVESQVSTSVAQANDPSLEDEVVRPACVSKQARPDAYIPDWFLLRDNQTCINTLIILNLLWSTVCVGCAISAVSYENAIGSNVGWAAVSTVGTCIGWYFAGVYGYKSQHYPVSNCTYLKHDRRLDEKEHKKIASSHVTTHVQEHSSHCNILLVLMCVSILYAFSAYNFILVCYMTFVDPTVQNNAFMFLAVAAGSTIIASIYYMYTWQRDKSD